MKSTCFQGLQSTHLGTSTNVKLAFSAATDFALAIFPSFIIYNLNMETKLKIGLCAVMAVGILYALQHPHP